MKSYKIIVLLGLLAFFAIINYAISEVVILKDGNKYIGKITDEGDTLKIATPDGEMTVRKDRIKVIYKDASAILKETTDIMTEAQKLIAGANKIEDTKERNATLDKSLEMLIQAQNICMDVVDVFSGPDGKAIGNQLKDINGTMKQARSLKVMDKELPPAKEEPKPAPPPAEPVEPQKPDTEKPQAKEIDPEKVEAAKEVYNLGLESFKNKKYEEARDFFIKAISYYEDYIEAYARLGDAYTALKDEESGYECYKKCLELIDCLPERSNEMAKLREEVLKKTEKFKPIEDKIAGLIAETGFKLMELGDQALANEDYLLAGEIFSFITRIAKDPKDAQEQLDKIQSKLEKEPADDKTEENSDLANTYYQSGLSLQKQSKYAEASEKFIKALTYNKNSPQALCRLGECYDKMGDSKSAIKNYRLGLRCLQDKAELSAEEKETIQSIRRNLEKVDTTGNEARKLRDKHISGLIAIASDCASKKYLFLAAKVYKQVLDIDPNNKAAADALQKIKKENPIKKAPAGPIAIFNGNDLGGLVVPKIWLNLWSVNSSCLFFNAKGSREVSAIQWEKQPPKSYIFSFEVMVERRVPADNYEISVLYGEKITGKELDSRRIITPINQKRPWTKVKFTLQNTSFTLEIDGKNIRTNRIQPCDNLLIGLYIQGFIARFRNLTVEASE